LLKGLWSYGGFKLRGSGCPQIFSAAKKSPSGHHPTTLSGYIFATKARIDSQKTVVKQQYLLHTSSQYGKLRPTNGWDRFGSLGHPSSKFQRLSRLGVVTYCSDVAQRRPTKRCTMFGRLLGCYTLYAFSEALVTWL